MWLICLRWAIQIRKRGKRWDWRGGFHPPGLGNRRLADCGTGNLTTDDRINADKRSFVSAAGSAGFPACGFAELSSSAMFSAVKTGDWKVPRTRRQECLRYGAK